MPAFGSGRIRRQARYRRNRSLQKRLQQQEADRLKKQCIRDKETAHEQNVRKRRDRDNKRTARAQETDIQVAIRRDKVKKQTRKKRKTETEDHAVRRRNCNKIRTQQIRLNQTPLERHKSNIDDATRKRRKRNDMSEEDCERHNQKQLKYWHSKRPKTHTQEPCHDGSCKNARKERGEQRERVSDYEIAKDIKKAVRRAKKYLHRTKDPCDPSCHKCHVCVVCDCVILGTERISHLSVDQLKRNKKRLGVEQYEAFHGKLHPELKKQYSVPDKDDPKKDLDGILLSPRARKTSQGWTACQHCKVALKDENLHRHGPPRYAIANGFCIGEFPKHIVSRSGGIRKVDIDALPDELRTLLAPVRPYGNIYAYTGGSHKTIQGTVAYYESDIPEIGGAFKHARNMGLSQNMYVMLCGRFTPHQRQIIRKRFKLNSDLFFDILNYFIELSGHPGYADMPVPDEFPAPIFVADAPDENNTDEETNREVEETFVGGNYYFSSGQDPNVETSVYEDSQKFAQALLTQTEPTLLTVGGTYADMKTLRVEDVLPFAFPFGIGGPGGPRRTRISKEACLQRYFRLSMKQFMRGDTILVLGHMYNRLLTYNKGIMICRSNLDGVTLGETLAKFSADCFKENAPPNKATELLLKAVNTSCTALGHTAEAAKDARRRLFAMTDHFGLNSIMFTISPCDLRSFRVRLFAGAGEWVSSGRFEIFTFLKYF